jgi:hypothetical protein
MGGVEGVLFLADPTAFPQDTKEIYPMFGSNQINAFSAFLSVRGAVCEGTSYTLFHRHYKCTLVYSLLLVLPLLSYVLHSSH